MNITILFFAELAELYQSRHTEMTCSPNATIDDLLDQLVAACPKMAAARTTIAIAVNEHYVHATHVLHDGDAVALIPPVSGG